MPHSSCYGHGCRSSGTPTRAQSSDQAVKAFAERLIGAGITTTVRKVRGDDIDAACGQLAGEIKDRTKLSAKRANREIVIKELKQGSVPILEKKAQ